MLSKGLSGVFSGIPVWKHQFFSAQPSLWSNSHIYCRALEIGPHGSLSALCPMGGGLSPALPQHQTADFCYPLLEAFGLKERWFREMGELSCLCASKGALSGSYVVYSPSHEKPAGLPRGSYEWVQPPLESGAPSYSICHADLCSASSVLKIFSCFFLLTFMVTAFLSDANKTVVSPFFLGGACHFKKVQLIWLPCNFCCLMGSWKVLIHRLSSFLLLLGWNLHFLAVVYILSGSSALVVDK